MMIARRTFFSLQKAWENKLKTQGTTLSKHYETYKKLRERELRHEEAGKERVRLPRIVAFCFLVFSCWELEMPGDRFFVLDLVYT